MYGKAWQSWLIYMQCAVSPRYARWSCCSCLHSFAMTTKLTPDIAPIKTKRDNKKFTKINSVFNKLFFYLGLFFAILSVWLQLHHYNMDLSSLINSMKQVCDGNNIRSWKKHNREPECKQIYKRKTFISN